MAFDIGMHQRIALRPQHIAFEFERMKSGLLLLGGEGMRLHPVDRKIRVALRLHRPGGEIGKRVARSASSM